MTLAQYYFSQFTTAQYLDFCCRLIVAFIAGGLIGLERSNRFKEAGVRTHIMVCVTTTLLMLISKYGFVDMEWGEGMTYFGTKGADAARVSAQAVSGLFLLQYVIYRMPFGADAYDGYHIQFAVRDSTEFEEVLRERLETWGAQVTDSSINWSREGLTEFDFVIRRADSIEYTDIKKFVDEHEEIVSFIYCPLTSTHLI